MQSQRVVLREEEEEEEEEEEAMDKNDEQTTRNSPLLKQTSAVLEASFSFRVSSFFFSL